MFCKMSLGHMLVVAFIVISLTDAASIYVPFKDENDLCDSEIYCRGRLLQTIQLAEIYKDSKTFVDLYQLHNSSVTLENFNELMRTTNNQPTRAQLQQYLSLNFATEDELHQWTPLDWQENPAVLKRIEDPRYREWARQLNNVWMKLARKMDNDVARFPNRYSLIYVDNGFIVPGGRFKEFYYWDSYWVIEGLLITGMNDTARGMIDNFLSMVEKYGFIPNGGRVYYLMRSQPPMLIPMVAKYLEFTKNYDYLRKNIGTLEKEFAFWLEHRTIDVRKDGETYTMARYNVTSPYPRPESFREDFLSAQRLPEESRGTFYGNLKAAAESGWDFSKRWFVSEGNSSDYNHSDIATGNIIPVELNALLERNARLLADFHTTLGNDVKAQRYLNIAKQFQAGISRVLWNEKEGIWFDYNIKTNQHTKEFYPTNLAPLYTMSYKASDALRHALWAVRYLKWNHIYDFYGGTPTSLNQTGEQWDFPNAWPPLQSFLILGLYQTGVPEAMNMAVELASRWLRSNYIGFEDSGKMFEKYDAVIPGQPGGGGEYVVQDGFGWTNGVVLELLHMFPNMKFVASEGAAPDAADDFNHVDR